MQTLEKVFSIKSPVKRHDALVDWLVKEIFASQYYYEVGKPFSTERKVLRVRKVKLIAEGAIYQGGSTGLFGPRIIFRTREDVKTKKWFFDIVFQFSHGPKKFAAPYKNFAIKDLSLKAVLFRDFMDGKDYENYIKLFSEMK
jgi:hypothetical protein